MNDNPRSRLGSSSLEKRLKAMPAVIVTGARQTGKSTLSRELIGGDRSYWTFDDFEVLATARERPEELLDLPGDLTFDEVQREPNFLLAIKRRIDEKRVAGRYLMTGSANLALMSGVADSLAGRASYLTLWPMTRREQLGKGRAGLWDELLAAKDEDWLEILRAGPSELEDWKQFACRGGFPTPAIHMQHAEERSIWFDGYVRTYLERDLRELSAVSSLPDFRRLMRLVCLRLGTITNQSKLASDLGLKQPTVHRYLNLLEVSYLLVRLPALTVNRAKRLIKSPKLYWADTGLAMHLAEAKEPTGAHLENLILMDLLAWRDARIERADVFYWRTVSGQEVDLVLEAHQQFLPMEIKASAHLRLADVKHLRSFQEEYAGEARAGLLIHAGEKLEWLTPTVLAVPWWRLI